jgi:hypothetical protein
MVQCKKKKYIITSIKYKSPLMKYISRWCILSTYILKNENGFYTSDKIITIVKLCKQESAQFAKIIKLIY